MLCGKSEDTVDGTVGENFPSILALQCRGPDRPDGIKSETGGIVVSSLELRCSTGDLQG